MNEQSSNNSKFFQITESDMFLDIFLSDKHAKIQEDFDDQKPFDLNLFKSGPDQNTIKQQQKIFIEQQEKQLQTKKKMKNTYASKIAKLIHQQNPIINNPSQVSQSIQKSRTFKSNIKIQPQQNSQDKKQQKLLKNRISAQKSRKIKKQYMQILEERVQQLEAQLQKMKKQNEKNSQHMKKMYYHQSIMNGYVITKQQTFQRLEKIIQSETKIDEQQINIQIDSLRYRFGATGKERTNLLSYYFKQIFDILIPDVHKYMMYSASNNVDIFGEGNIFEQNSEISKILNLSYKQKSKINQLYKNTLITQKNNFSELVNQFFKVRDRLEKQVKKIENLFDQIRKQISPISLVKFLIYLEKNKYSKDVSKIWNYWNKMVQYHLDDQIEVIRKQVKVNNH